ncbi:unnamed protein product [Caenorhabditis auriculariae]|uniref:EF-hand domain-containing protein n=1 Tax=Caenorhabditis auriculariae TaxID=2777116 RepID=A0A8S1HB38_9PELO|nr:unnamed protein product [Caenorhabditis auriculariae]
MYVGNTRRPTSALFSPASSYSLGRQSSWHFGSRTPCKNPFFNAIYWAFRRCQYWLCFYDDEVEVDVEDLLSNPFNTQPPSLDQLVQLTSFNRKWLMFMYRNFKQKCANGRMTESQWRILFRALFPNANDTYFVDRLYAAIISNKNHQQITFQDLVLFLWELTEGCHSSEPSCSSAAAQFTFSLMEPDKKGRVDELSFAKYTRSIFALTASRHTCDAAVIGLPSSSIYRTKSADDDFKPLSPMIARYASQRFKELDSDGDGFITANDIQRVMDSHREVAVLRSCRDVGESSEKK